MKDIKVYECTKCLTRCARLKGMRRPACINKACPKVGNLRVMRRLI